MNGSISQSFSHTLSDTAYMNQTYLANKMLNVDISALPHYADASEWVDFSSAEMKAFGDRTDAWHQKNGQLLMDSLEVASSVYGGGISMTYFKISHQLIKSKHCGVGSKLLGNSKAKGRPSLLNRPKSLVKVGWSGTSKNGGGSIFRIGSRTIQPTLPLNFSNNSEKPSISL